MIFSYFGFLKLKFFLFNALVANWFKSETTCYPHPGFSFKGANSQGIPTFLHSFIILVDTVIRSSNLEKSDEMSFNWKSHFIKLNYLISYFLKLLNCSAELVGKVKDAEVTALFPLKYHYKYLWTYYFSYCKSLSLSNNY